MQFFERHDGNFVWKEGSLINVQDIVDNVANTPSASDSILHRVFRRISSWFRSLTDLMGNCFSSTSDDDQLLRDGPSHSNSGEGQFDNRVRFYQFLIVRKDS